MSLITVVRDVCAVVGVAAPTSVFANIDTNRTMFEMLANANEMSQRIAYDTRDWTGLRKMHTFAGASLPNPADPLVPLNPTVFDLPSDYKRMLLNTNMWRSTSTQNPMRFISDHDEWLKRRNANESDGWGEWTMFGHEVFIHPGLHLGANATFMYLGKNCVGLASGGVSDRFLSDDDTFRLDERILKLGMIANWKQQKGAPYAEDMGTYSDAIANTMGHDKPAPILLARRNLGTWDAGFHQ